MAKLKTTIKSVGSTGPVIGFIASVFDILTPIAPYSLYLASGIAVVILLSLIARCIPFADKLSRRYLNEIWYIPFFTTMLICLAILMGSYYLGTVSTNKKGYLADNFKFAETIQRDLGVITEKLERIAKHTENIDKKMDNVKKETSSNPRKELSNMGIGWSVNCFAEAIESQDTKTIKLFVQGGMDPRLVVAKLNDPIFELAGRKDSISLDILRIIFNSESEGYFSGGNFKYIIWTDLAFNALAYNNLEFLTIMIEAGFPIQLLRDRVKWHIDDLQAQIEKMSGESREGWYPGAIDSNKKSVELNKQRLEMIKDM